jgi:hemolysin III
LVDQLNLAKVRHDRRAAADATVGRARGGPVAASAAEHAADFSVLSAGLILGAAGAAALFAAVLATDDAGRVVAAVGIYAAALPTMFLCALLYTAASNSPWWEFFRRLDHAAIFALIAATAMPFALARPGGGGLAAVIWAAAAAGIFVKFRYPIGRAYRSAAVFGVSGWTLMIALAPSVASRNALRLVVLGGALYTIGLGFHLWRGLRFRRAIWHGFVVAGATAHYLAVATLVL